MKKGISEHEFQQLCEGVERDSASILRERGDLAGDIALQRELFTRLCHRLEINAESSLATDLLESATGYSFAVMQMLEENMHPDFIYTDTLGPFLRRTQLGS